MRLTSRLVVAPLGVVALLVFAPSAHAQAWIGEYVGNLMAQQAAAESRHRCMTGVPMAEAEVTEALAPTNALMHAYFDAMQQGSANRASFYLLDRKSRWTFGEDTLDRTSLDRLPDPFADPGHSLEAQPRAFFRSGQEAWTNAQWQVRDGAGALVGTYTGLFVRNLGNWRIRELTLTAPDEWVEPARQFCLEPGDVLDYRIGFARNALSRAEAEVTRAESRLEREITRLAEAERALAERPDSRSRQERVAARREEVREKQYMLDLRRRELALARADQIKVSADVAEVERERADGLARLRASR